MHRCKAQVVHPHTNPPPAPAAPRCSSKNARPKPTTPIQTPRPRPPLPSVHTRRQDPKPSTPTPPNPRPPGGPRDRATAPSPTRSQSPTKPHHPLVPPGDPPKTRKNRSPKNAKTQPTPPAPLGRPPPPPPRCAQNGAPGARPRPRSEVSIRLQATARLCLRYLSRRPEHKARLSIHPTAVRTRSGGSLPTPTASPISGEWSTLFFRDPRDAGVFLSRSEECGHVYLSEPPI